VVADFQGIGRRQLPQVMIHSPCDKEVHGDVALLSAPLEFGMKVSGKADRSRDP
jgi:hypothetical protein